MNYDGINLGKQLLARGVENTKDKNTFKKIQASK